MRRFIGVCCLVLTAGCETEDLPTPLGEDTDEVAKDMSALDDFLVEQMDRADVPGLQVALTRDGTVLWANSYGYANEETETVLTNDHALLLASVSKTVTGVALMQLWEEEAFALDDDVMNVLDFRVRLPDHPDTPITYRHVLTHTSGIDDNWDIMGSYYVDGDSPVALGDFLERYLDPAGSEYSAVDNFWDWAPGTDSDYSNIAIALVGHLVEAHTGRDFAVYCDEEIFSVLGMEHTGWLLSDFDDVAMVANPHTGRGPVAHFGVPDYPNGQLRASATDIGAFMATFANGGMSPDGARILEPETIDEMMRVQYPGVDATQGLVWYYSTTGPDTVIGHNGGETGTSTDMYFRPSDGAGFVMLMNGVPSRQKPVSRLQEQLLVEAASF